MSRATRGKLPRLTAAERRKREERNRRRGRTPAFITGKQWFQKQTRRAGRRWSPPAPPETSAERLLRQALSLPPRHPRSER